MSERITALEEHLAHQGALLEDLNQIVSRQADEIDLLKARISLLMRRAAEAEADQIIGAPLADQKPPHW